MVPIRLETQAGELVTDKEAILPFDPLPAVVVWGTRFFTLHDASKVPVYRECFHYYITGLEKDMIRAVESP